MLRENLLIVLGLMVIVSPFSGLPITWLSWILPGAGFLVFAIAISLRRNHIVQSIPAE